jgi:hypothetical protein
MPTLNDVARAMQNAQELGDSARYARLMEVYNREYSRLYPTPKREEESGFLENIATGFGAGYVGTLESAALGAATLQEEEAELKSRQKIKSIADRFTPEGGDKDSIAYKLASGIGSIGAFATAAPLGKAALPIAGVLGVASGAGESSERARAYGATEEERNVAVRKGALIGATEVLPLGLLAKSLKIPGLPKAIDKISSKVSPATVTGIKSRLQRAAATGVKEGAQEAAAAVLQNLTEQGYNPEQVLFEAGVIEEGSIGGGAGAILQGLVDLFAGKKRFRPVKDTETEDTTTEEPTEDLEKGQTVTVQINKVSDGLGSLSDDDMAPQEVTVTRVKKLDNGDTVYAGKTADGQNITWTDSEIKDGSKTLNPTQDDIDALRKKRDDFRAQETKETPVPAETTATEETKEETKEEKPKSRMEGMVEDTLANMDVPQLEERLANAEQDAKNAGLPTGTYELMVKSAIKQKKEATDVGEQTARTPDAETTGDSVPSSPEVVGQQRTKGAGKPARPKQGRLDDSVSDTGRPARRKGRKQPALDLQERLKIEGGDKQRINLAELQRRETSEIKTKPPTVVEKEEAPITSESAPVLNKRTNKIRYAGSTRFVENHPAYSRDLKRLNDVYDTPVVKQVSKKTKDPAERKRLNRQNTVVRYFAKFDSPMDAIMDAARSVGVKDKRIQQETDDVYKGEKAQNPEFKTIDELLVGTSGANAESILSFVKDELSPETVKQIEARVEQFKKESVKAKKAKQKYDRTQKKAKALAEKKVEEERQAKIAEEAEAKKEEQVEEDTDVTSLAKELKEETKLSKADRAKASADANFDKFVSNPKTDLSKPNDFQKARGYAEAGTNPEAQIANLKRLSAKATTDTRKVSTATKKLGKKKKELGQTPKAKPSKLKVAVDKAKERLNNNKVTTQGLVLLSRDQNVKYLNKATIEEAITYSERAAEAQRQGYNKLYQNDGVTNNQLSEEISGDVMKALKENDIKGALLAARAQIKNPKLRSIANALIENMGTTQIMFLDNTRMDEFLGPVNEGAYNEGVFEPISNIIYLNENFPVTVHTLLHESTHAATYVYMKKNPNDKAVKELESLYEQVLEIGVLDNQYAKIDVYEFVAEVFSNPDLRRIMSRMRVEKDGTVKEGTISLYERFVAAIKNFFNRFRKDPLESVESGLTKADKAIREVLAPSPNVWDGVTELEPKLMAKGVNEALAPVREQAAENAKGFKNWWKDLTMGEKGLKGLAMGIHLQTLGDIARATGFGGLVTKLNELVENQTGRIIEAQDVIRDAEKAHKKFAQQVGTEAVNTYNRLIYNEQYGATIYDVNPFAPKLQYQGKYDSDGNDLYDVHDLQREELKKLTPTERKALEKHYNAQKKLYKDQFAAVLRAIKLESKNLLDKGDVNAQKQLDALTAELLKRATIEEYFPLVREGDFSVAYVYEIKDARGNFLRSEAGYEMFEHLSERDEYIKLLKEKDGVTDIKPYNRGMTKTFFDNAPNGTYVSEVLKTLKGAGVDRDVQEDIIKQFVSTLPATSVYRSLVKRGNVPGYIQDAGVALETKGRSLAAQAAKIESAAELRAIGRQIEEKAGELNNPKADAIADVALNKHIKFAIRGADNKGKEMIYKEFNQVAFLYTLGFNVSSAIVNLSQIPLFAVPYLGARYGLNNTIDAFTQASSVISGAKISVIEYYDKDFNLKESVKKDIQETAIDKADAKARIEYLESIIPIVREARQRGKLYSGDTLIELGVNEKSTSRDKLAHWSAFFFNGAERFNTQTTILATYDLVRKQMSDKAKTGEKFFSVREGKEITVPTDLGQRRALAAKEAMYQAQEVNGGARLETTAPIAKQGIGRVALMYKSYGLAMNTAMIKSGLAAGDKLYEGNPEEKKIAIKQLAGIHLSSLLFAGLGGVPLWGLVSMVWDLFLDDEEDDADTILRKHIGEMGFKGPLSTLTGVDVSARIKLNDLIFQENRFMRDPSLEESIGYYIGGPALSTAKRFYRSWNDFAEGEYWRGTEAALPAGFGNAMTAGRYFKDNGIKTRGGQFIYEDIGAGEIATKVFGFAPLEYTFRTSQSAAEQKISTAVTERRSKLTKRYFRAIMQRDTSEARDVLADIGEFNRRHPTAGISDATIKRSVKSQMDKVATMHNGVPVNKMMQYALEKSRREYKQWD